MSNITRCWAPVKHAERYLMCSRRPTAAETNCKRRLHRPPRKTYTRTTHVKIKWLHVIHAHAPVNACNTACTRVSSTPAIITLCCRVLLSFSLGNDVTIIIKLSRSTRSPCPRRSRVTFCYGPSSVCRNGTRDRLNVAFSSPWRSRRQTARFEPTDDRKKRR